MFYVKINDTGIQKFIKESPKRAAWAMKESLKAVGYKLKKKLKKQIEAGPGWAALSKATIEKKQRENLGAGKYRTSPLEIFERLVRMQFSNVKNKPVIKIGFFNTKSFFKAYYGVGVATIAELHETRIKSSKYGKRPKREILGPVWRVEWPKLNRYVELKFFKNFFSSKSRIAY